MSYLVLARKYRPQDFLTVTGQEQVTRTLANAIKRNKVAHAHLFAGPRGVGKTSIARIFAKALNCEKGTAANPCLECTSCKEITAGTSLAVREIDGASHNSVDNVRDLIESFRSLPPPGSKYKVYIIDEVHMLSLAAFNALLKSLEEPPPNTIFILATTEAHKIPETVLSRCVRHDFRAISIEQIEKRLKEVAGAEKLVIEPEVLHMIARLADGSMRDAQTLLDRVQSFCEEKITAVEASQVLGTVARSQLLRLVDAIISRDAVSALEMVAQIFQRGVDPALLLKEFVAVWRELLLVALGGAKPELAEIATLAGKLAKPDLQDLVTVARQGADSALRSSYIRYALEALVVRMATREPAEEIGALLAALKESGTTVSSAPSRSGAPPPPVRAKTAVQEMPSAPQPVARDNGHFSWPEFGQFAATTISGVLLENLKRCSASVLPSGEIEIVGPKFPIDSLQEASNAAKVKALLSQYCGGRQVSFRCKVITTEVEGAVSVTERKQEDKRRVISEEQIAVHPKIKSLQAAFPGSSIEEIKAK